MNKHNSWKNNNKIILLTIYDQNKSNNYYQYYYFLSGVFPQPRLPTLSLHTFFFPCLSPLIHLPFLSSHLHPSYPLTLAQSSGQDRPVRAWTRAKLRGLTDRLLWRCRCCRGTLTAFSLALWKVRLSSGLQSGIAAPSAGPTLAALLTVASLLFWGFLSL